MKGTRMLFGVTVAALLAIGRLSDQACAAGGSPPVVTLVSSGVGQPTVFDVTDANGADDIVGIGFNYTLSNGATVTSSLQITMNLFRKKAITYTNITNGKRITISAVPPGIAKITTTAFDKCFNSGSATGDAPGSWSRGKPRT